VFARPSLPTQSMSCSARWLHGATACATADIGCTKDRADEKQHCDRTAGPDPGVAPMKTAGRSNYAEHRRTTTRVAVAAAGDDLGARTAKPTVRDRAARAAGPSSRYALGASPGVMREGGAPFCRRGEQRCDSGVAAGSADLGAGIRARRGARLGCDRRRGPRRPGGGRSGGGKRHRQCDGGCDAVVMADHVHSLNRSVALCDRLGTA
jgi:hypothetical protein